MKLGLILFVAAFLLLGAFYGPVFFVFLCGALCGVAFAEHR